MIIDVIDATSPQDAHEITSIRSAGGHPIVLRGMCGAVRHVVQEIINRAGGFSQIELLRFHGHGAPGMMNFAAGTSAHFQHHSGVSTTNIGSTTNILTRLRLYFSPKGRVELHGCNVAQGPRGEKLIKDLAKIWGVPVSAGTQSQYGGGSAQFRFEGPVHTANPDGIMICGVPA